MDIRYKGEVNNFLDQLSTLSVRDFAVVASHALAGRLSTLLDNGLISVSGSDYSWVNRRVGEVIGPLLGSLEWPDDGLAVGAIAYTDIASRAIIRRARMSATEYEVFVGGFRQVGVVVPPHPSEMESAGSTGTV